MGIFNMFFQRKPVGRHAAVNFTSARERVAAGAAFLDEHQPGWHEAINVDTLELAHGGSCILGQLHGEFRIGLGRTSIFNFSSAPRASLSPVGLGFLCLQGVSGADQDRDYDLLNLAWQEEIRRRQADGRDAVRSSDTGGAYDRIGTWAVESDQMALS